MTLNREIASWEYVAYCLEGFAGLAGARTQGARAARLWGAAEALRRTMSAPLPPADRPDYERSMAAARACLDELSWEAAFAEGSMSRLKRQQSMPWEKATVPDRTTLADNGVGMVANSPESSTLSEVALFWGLPA